jgi:hypothetical protein
MPGDQPEKPIGRPEVNILGPFVNCTVCLDPKIYREQPELEGPGVPHEGNDPDQGRGEHQSVNEKVSRIRHTARDFAHLRRQLGRRMSAAPPNLRDQQHENQ